MENNARVHAVTWAARRGVYYVPVNTHLTAEEAGYVVGDSGARAVIGTRAPVPLCAAIVEGLPGVAEHLRLVADLELPGWLHYPDCVADKPSTPLADEREGDLLQYSSGTTDAPKGIRRALPGCAPAKAPVVLAHCWR